MMLNAPGFEQLITSLYPEGDDYIQSDAVFGVKTSLICKLQPVEDLEKSKSLGFPTEQPFWDLSWDFTLQTVKEAEVEKRKSLPEYYKFV